MKKMVEHATCGIFSAERVEMKKKDMKDWAWYPAKRLTEGHGILGRVVKGIEKWEPLERLGNVESRKVTPLLKFRKFIYGQQEREEVNKEEDNLVRLKFEELSEPIKKYAKQEAKKTGKSLNEIINSKPFKNYLLSRLK